MIMKFFKTLEEWTIPILVGAMLIFILAQILLRFVEIPMAYLQEASTLTFTWIIFFGAALGHRRGFKISVDIIVKLFPAKLRRRIEMGTEVLTLFFLIVIGVVSIKLMLAQKFFTSPALEMPVYIATAVLPISLGLMGAHTFSELIKTWSKEKC